MRSKTYAVYIIMTNKTNTVIYTGVTNNLVKRVFEHKNKLDPKSFTTKYNIQKLVWYKLTPDIYEAIRREKQIQSGSRKKKITLMEQMNPQWKDLYDDIL